MHRRVSGQEGQGEEREEAARFQENKTVVKAEESEVSEKGDERPSQSSRSFSRVGGGEGECRMHMKSPIP